MLRYALIFLFMLIANRSLGQSFEEIRSDAIDHNKTLIVVVGEDS